MSKIEFVTLQMWFTETYKTRQIVFFNFSHVGEVQS